MVQPSSVVQPRLVQRWPRCSVALPMTIQLEVGQGSQRKWRREVRFGQGMGKHTEGVGEGSAHHPWKTHVGAVLNRAELPNYS